jgi:hypothetical protein
MHGFCAKTVAFRVRDLVYWGILETIPHGHLPRTTVNCLRCDSGDVIVNLEEM